ncbi:MAG TPA: hypothetical protein VEY88_17750 [Archangium sp.]|nr:hypothetical protein [Archangium sp.]
MRKGLLLLAVVLSPLMVVGCGPQLEDETAPTTEEVAAEGNTGKVTQLKWVCGDGVCNVGETGCPEDCGTGGGSGDPWCGDGICNGTEMYSTCSVDCPYTPQPTICGDGTCQSSESSYNCPADCGSGGTCRTTGTGTSRLPPCEL